MNLVSLGFPLTHFILGFGFCLGIVSSFFFFGTIGLAIFLFLLYFEVIRIVPLLKRISNAFTGFFPEIVKHLEEIVKKSFTWELASVEQVASLSQPSIYLFHPHGAFSTSFYFHTMTPFTSAFLKESSSRPSPVVHRHLAWIPFAKEILEELGAVFNKYGDMKEVLVKGKSLAIIPGGIAEMNCVKGGMMRLHLGDGIFKLSKELQVPIVPVMTFGENELYELGSKTNPFLHKLQELCYRNLGLILPIPSWSSLKKWIKFMESGLSNPVKSYMGDPVFPSGADETAVSLKEKYKVALEKLYAAKKPESYSDKIEFF